MISTITLDCRNTALYRTVFAGSTSVAVSNLYLPGLMNVVESTVEVHADDTVYDLKLPACQCLSSASLVSYLQTELHHFAKFSITESGLFEQNLHDDCKEIVFSEKMNAMLGISGNIPINPFLFCKHVHVTSPLVELSQVNSSFLPLLYTGKAVSSVSWPIFRSICQEHLTNIKIDVLDMHLDTLLLDENLPAIISLVLKSS